MTLAYTICSANYLPFAKAVGDSLLEHNPDYKFVIVLLDRYRDVDVNFFAPHTIVHAEDMNIAELPAMHARYNIFELSCAFKPFAAEWLFKNENDVDLLFYLDSDLMVFNSFEAAEAALLSSSIVLTPHLLTSTEFKGRIYFEKAFLQAGTYNAGFFGLRKSETADSFLNWWKKRMMKYSFNATRWGLFVDQVWLNLVPAAFPGTHILSDPGYNVAYWNLGERTLTNTPGHLMINENCPLVFFHFSGYSQEAPERISRFYDHFDLSMFPAYRSVFSAYKTLLEKVDQSKYQILKPQLGTAKKKSRVPKMFRRSKNPSDD